ncbi:MAG: hypothetical protein RSB96_01820, partial [Oscillospiraceae bacterium]
VVCFLPSFLSISLFFFLVKNPTIQMEVAIGGLFLFFSLVLFIIALLLFIIIIQKYNLVVYLALENKISISQSFKVSAIAMKEYKMQFLYLYAQFLHLFVFCIFFIPIFYVIPYVQVSSIVLSKYIMCEKEKEILEVINKKEKEPKLLLIQLK